MVLQECCYFIKLAKVKENLSRSETNKQTSRGSRSFVGSRTFSEQNMPDFPLRLVRLASSKFPEAATNG